MRKKNKGEEKGEKRKKVTIYRFRVTADAVLISKSIYTSANTHTHTNEKFERRKSIVCSNVCVFWQHECECGMMSYILIIYTYNNT